MKEDSQSPCQDVIYDADNCHPENLGISVDDLASKAQNSEKWIRFAAVSVVISYILSFFYLSFIAMLDEKYQLKPFVKILNAGLSLHLFLIIGVVVSYYVFADKKDWSEAFCFKNWRYLYLLEAVGLEGVLFFPLAIMAMITLFLLNRFKEFLGPDLGRYIDTFPHFKQYLLEMEWSGFFLIAFIAVILAPTIEEIVFRRVIFSFLRFRLGKISALLLTSAFFAIIHFRIVDFPVLFILGCVWQIQYLYHKSLFPSILYHTFHNSLAMGLLFLVKFYDIPINI